MADGQEATIASGIDRVPSKARLAHPDAPQVSRRTRLPRIFSAGRRGENALILCELRYGSEHVESPRCYKKACAE